MVTSQAPHRSIARNTLLNGLTQALLILLSFLTYPVIARGVSSEGFGLLAIIWLLVGYLGIFDLGLGWAATRSIAQASTDNDLPLIRRIGWNSHIVGLIMGTSIGLLLYLFRNILVVDLLDIQADLSSDALSSVSLVALAVPFAVMNGISRGVLQGLDRFDIMNTIQIGMAAVQWIGSIILVTMGYGVLEITILTVAARIFFATLSLIWQTRLIPGLLKPDRFLDAPLIRQVLSFGGWVTISRVISPLFLYFDRLMIGTVLSLQAVGYYTVPQEAISRLLIIPMSLTLALFPVFSINQDLEQTFSTYRRSMRYLLVVNIPLTFTLVVFSREILDVWMGSEFALGGGESFRILSIGFFFNSLAQLPMTLLLSRGRPDLPAKFHLVEFPAVVLLAFVLLNIYGIIGVAIAWTLRVIVDAVLLFRSSAKLIPDSVTQASGMVALRKTIQTGIFFSAGFLLILLVESPGLKIGLAVGIVVAYSFVVWRHLLDETDRRMVTSLGARWGYQAGSGSG